MQWKVFLKRDVEIGLTTLRGECDMVIEAGIEAIHFEHGVRGHKLRNTRSHSKLNKARK